MVDKKSDAADGDPAISPVPPIGTGAPSALPAAQAGRVDDPTLDPDSRLSSPPDLHGSAEPAVAETDGDRRERQDAHSGEAHADEAHADEGGPSFASRALLVLLLLIAGAALGIWAAPRLAPMLPSGLAPVAAWLAPGASRSEAEIAALTARLDTDIAALRNEVAGLPAESDLQTRIDAAVAESRSGMDTEVATLREEITQIDGADARERLARIETTVDGQGGELAALKDQLAGGAVANGELNDEAAAQIDVYRAELEGLRAEVGTLSGNVAAFSSRIDAVAADADRQIETAQTRVAEVEADATERLDTAAVQSQVALIRAGLAAGQPFAEPVEQLQSFSEVEVPEDLAAAAGSGAATLAQLRERFGDAAHQAIRAGITADRGGGVLARSRAFLEAQVASRSLTPQAGPATDAVLSRMEDRLRNDDLGGALGEAEALPPEAAAAMSEWLAAARQRSRAESGLAALSADLSAMN